MIPLTMANPGELNVIQRVGGKEETRRHLENIGFVPGGTVLVVSKNGGNVIVNVKDARIALDETMACKVMI